MILGEGIKTSNAAEIARVVHRKIKDQFKTSAFQWIYMKTLWI